jgi:serine/threonine-protein kinase
MTGSNFPPPPGIGKLPSVVPPTALPPGTLRPPSAPRVALGTTRVVGHEMDRGSVTSVISSPEFRPKRRSRFFLSFMATLIGAGAVFYYTQRGGKVAVFVAGPDGNPLSSLTVHVDGAQKCNTSPCNLELDKGIHAIKVSASGYTAQEQGATVHPGDEIAMNFKLGKSSEGTGLKVGGKQDGVELFIDGKEIGPLPQEVKDLAPGPHKVLFKGSDRYEAEERQVTIDAEQMKDLGPVSLKVLRGLATFDVRTPGVKVTLASGKDRRQLTDFSQPVEIETSKNWTIEATKPGFEDMKQPIAFEDRAEKTFTIQLQAKSTEAPAQIAAVTPAPPRPAPVERAAPEPKQPVERPAPEPKAAAPAPAESEGSGNCTLNFNSIPVSNVVFDGKPLGGTPKLGYSAPPGSHTVIFVNADEGKKVTSVTCKAGETKTVAVRLSQ